ncbi:MAG: hypothetical protein DRH56_05050 [Deltaproteobacteria bacterium]|nr:MAG: hypothetical protein DRH56_05050 [Deltaproteobacteria bacterium]
MLSEGPCNVKNGEFLPEPLIVSADAKLFLVMKAHPFYDAPIMEGTGRRRAGGRRRRRVRFRGGSDIDGAEKGLQDHQ